MGPVMTWVARLAAVGTLIGMYQFNTQDIGLTERASPVYAPRPDVAVCRRAWKAQSPPQVDAIDQAASSSRKY